MENHIVDTDSLSLEQLAELAIGQPSHPAVEQPRNADGTFAPVADPAPVSVPDPTGASDEDLSDNDVVHNGELVYRLETDGEEVYFGHGPDSITRERDAYRQLREAKIHANKKIREQNQTIKATEAAKVALTADERYILAQRMQTEPDLVLDEAIEKRLASDPRIKAAEELATQNKINAVTTEWVNANPDYYAVPANGKRLWRELAANGVSVPTIADIDKAFRSLQSDGLLQPKPTEAAPVVTAPVRRSSGLSTRSTAVATPVVTPQLTEADLRKMPLEELAILANKQARGL